MDAISALKEQDIRKETDSLGVVEVPGDKLWGAQTQRSLEHFSIGQDLIPREMITAYATLKKGSAHRRMLHLTYTRRDLPQQLVQLDHLTQELYDRMSPVHRYLLEIEPPGEGGVLRQKKRDPKGWWN